MTYRAPRRRCPPIAPGLVAMLALAAGRPAVAHAQPVGSEFQVNTYTTASQSWPAVAADAAGDFVVVWQSTGAQDGDASGVLGQRYDSAGVPVGGEFQVNTYTTSSQFRPAVAADAAGGFVAVWESSAQDGSASGVFGQRYGTDGAPVAGEFQVNTYTTSSQSLPAVVTDVAGAFVAVWQSADQDGSASGVFGQRYSSAGAPVGSEFQINTYTTGDQYWPAVGADTDGDFVVVWASVAGLGREVFGQRYDSAGAPVGGEFQVNTYVTGTQHQPAVAADADGDFVVVWTSTCFPTPVFPCQDGAFAGVFGRRYSNAGAPVSGEFLVNTETGLWQAHPTVAADADGDFVVAWQHYNYGLGDFRWLFGQRYDSAGAPVGGEFQVNTYTTGDRYNPAVTAAAGGEFVVVWDSVAQDGSSSGVFGQRFQAIVATTTTSSTTTTTSTTLPPPIPVLSSRGGLFLAILLLLPMLRTLRRRAARPSATTPA